MLPLTRKRVWKKEQQSVELISGLRIATLECTADPARLQDGCVVLQIQLE